VRGAQPGAGAETGTAAGPRAHRVARGMISPTTTHDNGEPMTAAFKRALVHAASVGALALSAAAVHAQTLEAAGGLTFYKEVIEPNAQLIKERTGLTVKYAGPTTGLGIFLLVQGRAKVAFALDTLDESIKQAHAVAKEQGTPLVVPPDLVYKQFSTDRLVPIVNRQNPVASLTKAQ